jgi:LPXTG-site transpeptidase (sortase) family protein
MPPQPLGEIKQHMPGSVRSKAFRAGELLSYTAGVLLTGFFAVQLAQGEVERRQGIEDFERLAQATSVEQVSLADPANTATPATSDSAAAFQVGDPDTTLWAPGRIDDYQTSLKADLPPLLGVLEIPSVDLKVPVYSTSTELTMDRGAGIIDGMAYPHEEGNIGISGHRDGYFRVLKDIKLGDRVVLQTLKGPKNFTIKSTGVVEISDTSLLQDTWDQTVTLVTCYPFYFVGHAPKRFIVTASLD